MIITPGGIGEIIKSHFLFKKYKEPISKTAPLVLIKRYHDAAGLLILALLFSVMTDGIQLKTSLLFIAGILIIFFIIVRNRSLFQKVQNIPLLFVYINILQKN